MRKLLAKFLWNVLFIVHPAIREGLPQPHEDASLRDGDFIKDLRKQSPIAVGRVAIFRDGDRVVLRKAMAQF